MLTYYIQKLHHLKQTPQTPTQVINLLSEGLRCVMTGHIWMLVNCQREFLLREAPLFILKHTIN